VTVRTLISFHLMNAEPTVREACVEDAAILHGVLTRAFCEYAGLLDPPSGVHAETVASLARKVGQGGALICEAGGDVVGCAFYTQHTGYLYVGRFGVLPEHRRSGVGALLLVAAERRARALGYTRVRLNVRLVLGKLRAYYEARGYLPIDYLAHEGYTELTYVEMEKAI
jgi:GNAT superfamily N-acetyltransferase